MNPVEAYQPLGLLTTIVVFSGLVFLIKKWPQGMHMTYSQHAARQKQSIRYYLALFTVTLPLLLLFAFKWFGPTFNMPTEFYIFFGVSTLTHYLCLLIPEVGGWKTTAHQIFAFWSAIFLLPVTLSIASSVNVHAFARVTALLAACAMAAIILFLFVVKIKHRFLLLLQTCYYLCFFIALLAATYIR